MAEVKTIKFNNLVKAEQYIEELGYVFKQSNQFKEDRSFVYQKPRSKQYLNANTMEMGTVWTLQQF